MANTHKLAVRPCLRKPCGNAGKILLSPVSQSSRIFFSRYSARATDSSIVISDNKDAVVGQECRKCLVETLVQTHGIIDLNREIEIRALLGLECCRRQIESVGSLYLDL